MSAVFLPVDGSRVPVDRWRTARLQVRGFTGRVSPTRDPAHNLKENR